MADLDIGRAAFSGFRLISRHPAAVLAWGVFIFIVAILPVFGLFGSLGSTVADLVAAEQAGREPSPDEVGRLVGVAYAFQPLLFVSGILVRVMITGAVFRAVIEPTAKRWFFLRLGMAEVMLGLVVICLGILFMIAAAVWALLGVGFGFAAYQASPQAAWAVGAIFIITLIVGLVWLALRLSLAPAMSFAEKNFRLFESWTMTRGQSLKLFLVAVLQMIIVMVLEAIVGLLAVGVLLAVAGSGALEPTAIEAFFRQSPEVWMKALGPWLLVGGLVVAIAGAAGTAIITAPWADVYRQLAGESPAA